MAQFTFDEGSSLVASFGPGFNNQVDVVDNGVTFRFAPTDPALGGSLEAAPGTFAPLTLDAIQANTSLTLTLPDSNVQQPAQFNGAMVFSVPALTGSWTVVATGNNGATTTFTQSGNFFFSLATGSFVSLTFTATTPGRLSISQLIADLTPAVAQDDAFTVWAMNPVLPGENALGDTVGDLHNDNGSGADIDADGELDVDTVNGVSAGGGAFVTTGLGASVVVLQDGRFRYDGTGSATLQALALGATTTDSFTYTNTASNSATVTLTVMGTGGRTIIDGDGGDDTITPTANFHYILAGAGNDTIVYDAASVPNFTGSIVDGQAGTNDTLRLTYSGNDDVTFDLTGISLTGIETIDAVRTDSGNDSNVDVTLTVAQAEAISAFDGDLNDFVSFQVTLGSATTIDLRGAQVTSGAQIDILGDNDAEVIYGSEADDDISDGGGGDLVFAGAGNDQLESIGSGADTIFGGDNNDSFGGDLARDSVYGDVGDDTFSLFGAADILPSGFTLDGGTGTDRLSVFFDTYDFRTETVLGFETLEFNSSSTLGIAGATFTATQIQQFSTIILGQRSASIADPVTEIEMDAAVTTLDLSTLTLTNFGNSTIASPQFVVNGDASDEVITGTAVSDVLYGNGGNDTLTGLDGDDILYGGAGNDTLTGGVGADAHFGGEGTDTADYSGATADIRVSLVPLAPGAVQARGDAAGDTFFSIENVVGTAFNDEITGDNAANTLFGGGGDDNIVSGLGNDVIYGGAGRDFFPGVGGTDSIFGGADGDTLQITGADNPANALFDGGTGIDALTVSIEGQNVDLRNTSLISVEKLSIVDPASFAVSEVVQLTGDQAAGLQTIELFDLSSTVTFEIFMGSRTSLDLSSLNIIGTPSIVIRGDGDAETITGSTLADVVYGGGSDDIIYGGEGGGTNQLFGGAGNDTISGGTGNDFIEGGAGADSLIAATSFDGGIDTLNYASSSTGVSVNLETGIGSGGDAEGDRYSGKFDVVIGTAQGDTLVGSSNFNSAQEQILYGGEGDDILDGNRSFGSAGGASYGEAGNDTFRLGANSAPDNIYGGADADTLDASAARSGVEVNLGSGDVSLRGFSASITGVGNVVGSPFNDSIIGDDLANSLSGGVGSDTLFGGGGNDTLVGGANNDTLSGGTGADSLDGGTGTGDLVSYSTSSSAVVVNLQSGSVSGGDAQGDSIVGFEGIEGTTGNDTLTGSDNANTFFGLAGNDFLYGGAGNDILYGGEGDNYYDGGAGADIFNDLISNGIGTLSYANSSAAVTVDLNRNKASGGDAEGDRFDSDFEVLIGSAHNDTLTAETGIRHVGSVIYGGNGDDIITGSQTSSPKGSSYGDAGNDTFKPGDSSRVDNVYGGPDNDTLDLRDLSVSDLVIDLGANSLTAFGGLASAVSGVENVFGAQAPQTIKGDGLANSLSGNSFSDTLRGDGGDDRLLAKSGNDTVLPGAGNDTADGGSGSNDMVSYADLFDTTPSRDTFGVRVSLADQGSVQVTRGNPNRDPSIGSGNDLLTGFENLTGSGGVDNLFGDANDNILRGLENADALTGAGGNDTIFGGAGSDILVGGAGADILYGGDLPLNLDRASWRSETSGVTFDFTTPFSALGNRTSTVVEEDSFFGIEGWEGSFTQFNEFDATDQAESFNFFGGQGGNVMYGGDGGDGAGAGLGDGLVGFNGVDSIFGNEGGDIIWGRRSDDYLDAGRTADGTATDGDADQFNFEQRSGNDTVANFEVGLDRVFINPTNLDDTASGAANDGVFDRSDLQFSTVNVGGDGAIADAQVQFTASDGTFTSTITFLDVDTADLQTNGLFFFFG